MIETNTYAMTFKWPIIPEKIKVGYTMERVEPFILNPLRCYKCQRYEHHEDNCRRKELCGKCGQQNTDHHINDCDFPNKCANCGGDHPVYSRSSESWRQEKEILTNTKTIFQLERGEWERYINKIKSTFNIVRAPETPNTSVDLAENKEPPTQTQTPLEKADHNEKPIPSTSRSIKIQIMKSPPKKLD